MNSQYGINNYSQMNEDYMQMSEKLMQSKEAAEYTGAPRDFMLNQAKAGHITYLQVSPKKIMFRKADLDSWMEKWKEVNAQ
jgi:excisionase family DNA binding protein